ncbi:MAG: hypothetical protein WC975_12340, partial [Phycisphaerae bacterium]
NNQFTITNVQPGAYDIAIRAHPFLQKVLTAQTVGNATLILDPVTLTGGDVDGDNAITSSDMAIILTNMDQVLNP